MEDTSIVVRLTEWHGELGVDIRKYIATAQYEGYTRQGVRLHKKGFKRLVKLLCNKVLDEQAPQLGVIGKIAKDFSTDIVVQITDFSGSPKLDIREQLTSSKGTYFTQKGISLPIDSIPALRKSLLEAEWLLDEMC